MGGVGFRVWFFWDSISGLEMKGGQARIKNGSHPLVEVETIVRENVKLANGSLVATTIR